MAKKDGVSCETKFKTTCGGQALIEGILMQGPEKRCVVVRKADGELSVETEPVKKRTGWKALPFIRGVFVFCGCMDENHKSPLHADTFDFDERALVTGLALFIGLTAGKE